MKCQQSVISVRLLCRLSYHSLIHSFVTTTLDCQGSMFTNKLTPKTINRNDCGGDKKNRQLIEFQNLLHWLFFVYVWISYCHSMKFTLEKLLCRNTHNKDLPKKNLTF